MDLQAEERHAALMAVSCTLTAAEQVSFLGHAVRMWPRMEGATVADVLDYTTDYDMYLAKTEAFFEKFAEQMPDDLNYAPRIVAHVILILGLPLTPGRVLSFLQRAGVVDPPRFPEVEVGLHASRPAPGLVNFGHTPDANHLLLMARARQGLRAAGTGENVITEFRETVRRYDDKPGYSRNAADIAKWVTLVDRYTEMPRRVYDPTDDIALVLGAVASDAGAWASPAEIGQALRNLRSHLDMRAPETIKSSLCGFYGKVPE
jgi:hypothetical protein